MKSLKIFFMLCSLIPLAVSPVFGESLPVGEYPSYQDGILTIPCVDTPEQPCMFQDVKFQLTEEGDWRLTDYRVGFTSPFVDTVETIVTDTFPVQVFLKVKGFFPVMGPKLGRIPQRLKDNRFEIVMYAVGAGGFPMVEYFEEVIPLSVYGLSAGTYEYSLSGVRVFNTTSLGSSSKTFTGTFVLTRDNKLGAATEIGIGKTTLEVSGTDTFTAHQVSVPGYDGLYWGIFQWNPYTLSWTLKDAGLEK